ncbi:hypothetical protein BIW11_02247 [Tropilaelaps mercedesae]|uniref:Splicing factor Cactin n=1 Tax=Tropilaelaps mercedesae TaxID=418985 RepID=A0A1V9X0S0_9ACAR|nr:hypothetical protein BIW11_02247 [Tropilaelaps mercedesae]
MSSSQKYSRPCGDSSDDSAGSGSNSDDDRSWRRERSDKNCMQTAKKSEVREESSYSTSKAICEGNYIESVRCLCPSDLRKRTKSPPKIDNRKSPERSVKKHSFKYPADGSVKDHRKNPERRKSQEKEPCAAVRESKDIPRRRSVLRNHRRSRQRRTSPPCTPTSYNRRHKDYRRRSQDQTSSGGLKNYGNYSRGSRYIDANKVERSKESRSHSRSRNGSLDEDFQGKVEAAGRAKCMEQKHAMQHSNSVSSESRNSPKDIDSGTNESETERKKKTAMGKGEREKYEEFLKQEELRRKEEKKRLKELMKERETPEQKRARRLAKKEAKERKRKQEMGWDEEYAGYTNHDNPFGDSNLLHTFKWKKKLEKEGFKDIKDEELEKMSRRKREEQRQELEKVKERRLERERERAERDAAIEMEQRQREGAQFEQWAAQEDSFHLQQAKLRSKIRIKDGRAKPIDLLARYISAEEEDFSVDMIEPYFYLNGLTLDDFEDLIEDINVYMRLESKKNQEYWNDIRIIVDEEVRKLNNEDNNIQDERGGRSAISSEVSSEIVNVFKGKTPKQLEVLKSQIELKLSKRAPGLDVAYWETLLSRLRSYMAKARLRERHEENLSKKLEQLKVEQGVAEEEHGTVRDPPSLESGSTNSSQTAQDGQTAGGAEKGELDPLQQSIEDYELGRYTPVLVALQDLEPGTLLTDPDEDEQRREARKLMLRTGGTAKLTRVEEEFEREARKGMDTNEARFSVEETLIDSQSYQWSDKWRPRKPRYFNRVHTGFEWNKYNQTHYDIDNPPPKIVQGYKFNIFYPDLIDKNKTPQYFLIPCKDNGDFSILRFHAGPPYEDIAFKVVNREWEYSYKKGFRCQFHNDIFQLWFHFKRYRYRR